MYFTVLSYGRPQNTSPQSPQPRAIGPRKSKTALAAELITAWKPLQESCVQKAVYNTLATLFHEPGHTCLLFRLIDPYLGQISSNKVK